MILSYATRNERGTIFITLFAKLKIVNVYGIARGEMYTRKDNNNRSLLGIDAYNDWKLEV